MKKEKISQHKQGEENDKDDSEYNEKVIPVMQKSESEALKYVLGYCVSHLQLDCVLCMKFSKVSSQMAEPVDFITFASSRESCLARPSNEVVSLLQYAKNYFRQKEKYLHGIKNIHKSLLNTLLESDITNTFPKCHNTAKNLSSFTYWNNG